MNAKQTENLEKLQHMLAGVVARNPAGRNLVLIGGFRYRLLNGSARFSGDVDYHWEGDLAQKQTELVALFKRVLLPQARRSLDYCGRVAPASGPDADSPIVRVVNLAFWKENTPKSRIEIPVDITKIATADPYQPGTREGTMYLTVSDQDMVESKIIALLNRTFLAHRDFLDIFLFQDQLEADSPLRLASKLRDLDVSPSRVSDRISDCKAYPDYHAGRIQEVMDAQLDSAVADNFNDLGGGRMVLNAVLDVLDRYVQYDPGADDEIS